MLGAVETLVRLGAPQPESAGHVDHAHVAFEHRLHELDARLMRKPHQHDVDAARGFGERRVFEHEVGQPLEVRVRGRKRLADVIDRADADELHVRMPEQPAHQLGAGKPGAAEDCRSVALHAESVA